MTDQTINKFSILENTKTTDKKESHLAKILVAAGFVLCAGFIGFQQWQIHRLNKQIEPLQNVYIYDLEETLRGVRLDEFNREFEAKINILNDEVSTAQLKISSLKDSKEKDDFSEVYLKSLKLKRDTMLEQYNRSIQEITDEINAKISEIAQERNALVVFDRRAVTAKTPHVIDVTEEIVKRAQVSRPKFLDE